MATWTAEKRNPRSDGLIFMVDVAYLKDGVENHIQTYETNQDQAADWPADLVNQHIKGLQALETLPAKITTGTVTLPADPVVDAAAQAWQSDYALASRAKILVDLGVIPANNAKYTALLTRLKNNFKPEYIGLI